MRRAILIFFTLLIFATIYVDELHAIDSFGLIFDIQGNAEIRDSEGKITKLKRSGHLLRPVKEGDRIRVANGRVVIVSMKENKGYEIVSNSEALVKDKKIIAVKGKISEVRGLHPPGEGTKGSIGGIVLRKVKPCMRAISPVNTYILESTPELVWENNCYKEKKVTVKIICEERIIFSAESEGSSIKVPETILKYGKEYRWIVDSGRAYNISEGAFYVHEENEIKNIRENITHYTQYGSDLPLRLSYIFYLLDKNLNEMAKAEIKRLNVDFPENTYIKQLVEEAK
jgi:hypothetical protein